MTIEEWLGEDNQLGKDILEKKYLYKGESLDHWFDRVSGGDPEVRQLIVEKKFLPGGRILAHRGIPQEETKATYSNCFKAGVQVLMGDGSKKPIEEIEIGETVRTINGEEHIVNEVMEREYEGDMYQIVSKAGGDIICTPNHKFLIGYNMNNRERTWKEAKDLEIGDILSCGAFVLGHPESSSDTKTYFVEYNQPITEIIKLENQKLKVYNISVEDEHNYIVENVIVHNCYVLGTDDSIEDIYATCAQMARTYSLGGGVGVDISKLRPRGAIVHNSAKETTGAVSFMKTFDVVTETIGQSGRRGKQLECAVKLCEL